MKPSASAVLAVAGALVVAGPSADGAATAEEPATPVAVAIPPASASPDVAPVVAAVAPVHDLVAPRLEVVRRTAAVDGAVGHDEASDREVFTLSGDVFFEFDSADLTDRARAELADIATLLADAGPVTVAVVGHTDTQGSSSYNDELSLARATTVRDALAEALPGVEITAEGRGEREPIAEEEGSAEAVERARALNRRVTVDVVHEPAAG